MPIPRKIPPILTKTEWNQLIDYLTDEFTTGSFTGSSSSDFYAKDLNVSNRVIFDGSVKLQTGSSLGILKILDYSSGSLGILDVGLIFADFINSASGNQIYLFDDTWLTSSAYFGFKDGQTRLYSTTNGVLTVMSGSNTTGSTIESGIIVVNKLRPLDTQNIDFLSTGSFRTSGSLIFKDTGFVLTGSITKAVKYVGPVTGNYVHLFCSTVNPLDHSLTMTDPALVTDQVLLVEKDIQTFGSLNTDSDPEKGYGGGAILIGHGFEGSTTPPRISLTDSNEGYDTLELVKLDGTTLAHMKLGTAYVERLDRISGSGIYVLDSLLLTGSKFIGLRYGKTRLYSDMDGHLKVQDGSGLLSHLYTSTLYVDHISGSTDKNIWSYANLIPTGSCDLGSSSAKWTNLWVTNINGSPYTTSSASFNGGTITNDLEIRKTNPTLWLTNTSGDARVIFHSGSDQSIIYSSGSYLRTDTDGFIAENYLWAKSAGFDELGVTNTISGSGGLVVGSDILSDTADTDSLGSASKEWKNLYIGSGKIYFGTSQTSNLYESGSGILRTDNALSIGGTFNPSNISTNNINCTSLACTGTVTGASGGSGDAFEIGNDAYLVDINIDGAFAIQGRLDRNASKIYFGNTGTPPDTYIYRSSAGILKTLDLECRNISGSDFVVNSVKGCYPYGSLKAGNEMSLGWSGSTYSTITSHNNDLLLATPTTKDVYVEHGLYVYDELTVEKGITGSSLSCNGLIWGGKTSTAGTQAFKIGDDAYLVDRNLQNGFSIEGTLDSATGVLAFGSATDVRIQRHAARVLAVVDESGSLATLDTSNLFVDHIFAASGGDISFLGSGNILVSGSVQACSNGGPGDAFKIGNDAWLVDSNIPNGFSVQGASTRQSGSIYFGSGLVAFIGRYYNSDLSRDTVMATDLMPAAGNDTGWIGTANRKWDHLVVNYIDYYGELTPHDSLDDLSLVKNYRVKKEIVNGVETEVIDKESLSFLKSKYSEGYSLNTTIGFLLGCIKQLVKKTEEQDKIIAILKNKLNIEEG